VLVPVAAFAQAAVQHVGLSLIVSHASAQPGPIDPEMHRVLGKTVVRYQSLRVIERRHIDLRMQEIGGVDLPTGKRVEVMPLSMNASGVLISLEVPGTLQTDLRVANQKQVVIGLDRYDDGKLILVLQPDY
jgi:hypothetical protein